MIFPAVAAAQTTTPSPTTPSLGIPSGSAYTLLEPLPCIPGGGVTCGTQGNGSLMSGVNFTNYIQYLFNLFIALAAASAVFMIILGGLEYMTVDSWSGKAAGRTKAEHAVLGLLLVLTSYVILRTIDPRLVAVPTTLVSPLNITVTKGASISDLFNTLTSDAAMYKQQNAQLMNDISAANNQVNSLETQKYSLESQIAQKMGISIDSVLQECQSANISDQSIKTMCAQIVGTNDKINQITGDMYLKTAIGTMNGEIEQCYGITTRASNGLIFGNYGNGLNIADCQDAISTFANKYGQQLYTLGQDDKANQIISYMNYSNAIVEMNADILTNMSSSPQAQALIKDAQAAAVVAGTAVGTAASGGVTSIMTGFAGAAIGKLFENIVVGGLVSSNNRSAAIKTIDQIKAVEAAYSPKIQDPRVLAQFQAQTAAFIRNLGGK